jgi:acetyltransferase
MGLYNLDKFFKPRSIAIIGASEKKGTIGHLLVRNLDEGHYPGKIYPVNPSYPEIMDLKAYPSIRETGEPVDLAVIATPIGTAPQIVRECVEAGTKAAIIVSAGGRETGPEGLEIEKSIEKEAAKGNLRILGPNCMGLICPKEELNVSFAVRMPRPGKLAFISQSGAICVAMLDLALSEQIGYSYFVSIGSMLDVDFGDLIDYLGNDTDVESILLYIESLTNIRRFMSAARAVSRIKPIVALKSGRSAAGARAAASHTGAMAGEDAVYDAAFKRAGIVRVNSLEDFFDCAELLAKQRRPTGRRIVVITNAGGPGVMAADAVVRSGLELASLGRETLENLSQFLPPYWSRGNPVDILADATPERYASVVDCCFKAEEVDGLLVILNPQATSDPSDVAKGLSEILKNKSYPVFTVVMGGAGMERGRTILNEAGLPTYDTPERAIRSFMYLYNYSENLKILQEIPPRLETGMQPDHQVARSLIDQGLRNGTGLLTEAESKELLASFGIPVNRTATAGTEEEAVRAAQGIGYPVVMKVLSRDIIHKTEARGVRTDLGTDENVREAYREITQAARKYKPDASIFGVTVQAMIANPDCEILLGAKTDDGFGPVILFGAGGIYAEALEDKAVGLPPLNRSLARRIMEETKIYRILKGFRNRPAADLALLEEIMVALSHLLADFPEIVELDMNPILVSKGKPVVADARIVLRESRVKPPLHLSISPYPEKYEFREVTSGGLEVLVRPIKPEDAPLLVELFRSMSSNSIYYRFFSPMKRLPESMLARFTQIDYDREIALVALREEEEGETMIGVARIICDPDLRKGEFALAVGDPWQRKGVGARLLELCLALAREYGIEKIEGNVLADNEKMLRLGARLGFKVRRSMDVDGYVLEMRFGEPGSV